MKCILANPNIAPHIRETMKSYLEHGYLDKFYTSYFFDPSSKFNRMIDRYFPTLAKELQKRSIETNPSQHICSRPVPELLRVFSSRKFNGVVTDKIWEWGELGFDKWVAEHLPSNVDWVHTCEHAGLRTLLKAKELGIMSIHEQPSLHHSFFSEIIARQAAIYPEFSMGTTKLLFDENSMRRNKRRDEELKVADYILCNSSFTKKTLTQAGINPSKVIIIPLGFPAIEKNTWKSEDGKVIFMFAGNIGFGKGIHLLLEAWKEIDDRSAELWLIGNIHLPKSILQGLPETLKFLPRVPHVELMSLYQKADVFVHPTLADGFGMVISEAMSRGLPVITTHNSGGADLIDEQVNGIVIRPESKEAIIQALTWCIQNKHKLAEMGKDAQHQASKYPWSAYRKSLVKEIIQRRILWGKERRFAS